jgi:hypothetical protein
MGCVAAAVIALTGCTYPGPAADNPVGRRLTWYSYLNGDDMRRQCEPGAPPAYRFVYNGVYVQQIRTYDIRAAAEGRGTLRVRVIGPVDLSNVAIRARFTTLLDDLAAPWAGTREDLPLTAADLDRLDSALAASGFFQPAPRGLYLRGEDFFWIAAACINGAFHFNAYKWPQPAFARATFPAVLLALDPTGIPLNPPRPLSTFDIYRDPANEPGIGPTFTLTVGDNGLAAVRPLF